MQTEPRRDVVPVRSKGWLKWDHELTGALRRAGVSPGGVLVFQRFAQEVVPGTRWHVSLSQDRIACDLGMSHGAVGRAIRKLEGLGLLPVVKRGRKSATKAHRSATVYDLEPVHDRLVALLDAGTVPAAVRPLSPSVSLPVVAVQAVVAPLPANDQVAAPEKPLDQKTEEELFASLGLLPTKVGP